jgi:hypothetical protein
MWIIEEQATKYFKSKNRTIINNKKIIDKEATEKKIELKNLKLFKKNI